MIELPAQTPLPVVHTAAARACDPNATDLLYPDNAELSLVYCLYAQVLNAGIQPTASHAPQLKPWCQRV